MNRSINIAGRLVGQDHPPFVIAEMSGNHNSSLDRALQIVEAAAKSGAAAQDPDLHARYHDARHR